MTFNTKYILPGDDAQEIIFKTNFNFEQVFFSGVGSNGPVGLIGPTGIIGQVGNDGTIGELGLSASKWNFSFLPPVTGNSKPGDYWVNTGPTSGFSIFEFQNSSPFWVDSGFDLLQNSVWNYVIGVSGPGGIEDKTAIGFATGPSGNTFVFSDYNFSNISLQLQKQRANPTGSKFLIGTDGTRPLLSFGKTSSLSNSLPQFSWEDNSPTNYNLKFESPQNLQISSKGLGLTAGASGGSVSSNRITLSTANNIQITNGSLEINSPLFQINSPNLKWDGSKFSGFYKTTIGGTGSGFSCNNSSGPGFKVQIDGTGATSGTKIASLISEETITCYEFLLDNTGIGSTIYGYTDCDNTPQTIFVGANTYVVVCSITTPYRISGAAGIAPVQLNSCGLASIPLKIFESRGVGFNVAGGVMKGQGTSGSGFQGKGLWVNKVGFISNVPWNTTFSNTYPLGNQSQTNNYMLLDLNSSSPDTICIDGSPSVAYNSSNRNTWTPIADSRRKRVYLRLTDFSGIWEPSSTRTFTVLLLNEDFSFGGIQTVYAGGISTVPIWDSGDQAKAEGVKGCRKLRLTFINDSQIFWEAFNEVCICWNVYNPGPAALNFSYENCSGGTGAVSLGAYQTSSNILSYQRLGATGGQFSQTGLNVWKGDFIPQTGCVSSATTSGFIPYRQTQLVVRNSNPVLGGGGIGS